MNSEGQLFVEPVAGAVTQYSLRDRFWTQFLTGIVTQCALGPVSNII